MNNRALILLAPGFEEKNTISMLYHMREAGLPTSLVSLTAGLVEGEHGVTVRPDYSLDQLLDKIPRLIIVPGGRQCISSLGMDPRVHELLQATLNNDGFVAAADTAESLLTQFDITTQPVAGGSHVIHQQNMETEKFTRMLINLLTSNQ